MSVKAFVGAVILVCLITLYSKTASAADFMVYGLYRALDMGSENEKPPKDYYINMGAKNGLSEGATLEILRKSSTYDVLNHQLHPDMLFPIARVKVIHLELTTAVARLDKMLPVEQTPIFSPNGIMVGDLVRPLSAAKPRQ